MNQDTNDSKNNSQQASTQMAKDLTSEQNTSRRKFITWLWRIPVIAAVGTAIWGTRYAYNVHFDKSVPSEVPDFSPIEPIEIGQVDDLALWEQQDFTIGQGPFMLINTPEAISGGLTVNGKHFIAFSSLCTHQLCPVQLNSDTEAIAVAFNHRTEHPSLVCHCHLSVFDVMGAGEVVSGPARKALPRVELELRNNTIYAIGLEI